MLLLKATLNSLKLTSFQITPWMNPPGKHRHWNSGELPLRSSAAVLISKSSITSVTWFNLSRRTSGHLLWFCYRHAEECATDRRLAQQRLNKVHEGGEKWQSNCESTVTFKSLLWLSFSLRPGDDGGDGGRPCASLLRHPRVWALMGRNKVLVVDGGNIDRLAFDRHGCLVLTPVRCGVHAAA